jgi:hypothetical protein
VNIAFLTHRAHRALLTLWAILPPAFGHRAALLIRSPAFAIPLAATLAAALAAFAVGIGTLAPALTAAAAVATFRSLLLGFALLTRLTISTRPARFTLLAWLDRSTAGHAAESNRTGIGRILRSLRFRRWCRLASWGRSRCGLSDRE